MAQHFGEGKLSETCNIGTLDSEVVCGQHVSPLVLSYSKLAGFAQVSYYAPALCHNHPLHNCHHIKLCPAYICKTVHYHSSRYRVYCHGFSTYRAIFDIKYSRYTCSKKFISNAKVSRAKAGLWVFSHPSLQSFRFLLHYIDGPI